MKVSEASRERQPATGEGATGLQFPARLPNLNNRLVMAPSFSIFSNNASAGGCSIAMTGVLQFYDAALCEGR
jgi:hypothetical protein